MIAEGFEEMAETLSVKAEYWRRLLARALRFVLGA